MNLILTRIPGIENSRYALARGDGLCSSVCWPLCIMPLNAISILPLSLHYNKSKLIVETTIVDEDDENHTQCHL